MQLTRRHFITTWGASATVVLLAACTAQPVASPTSPVAPAATPAQSAPTQSAPAAPRATILPATPAAATAPQATALVQDQVLRAPEPNPKRGGILRYIAAGIGTAHYDLHQGASPNLLAHTYEGLVTWNILDGLNSIAPSLAERWEVSPDGKVYAFYLRDGVKFHDGKPFSADDVVATFQRILFPPSGMVSVYKDLFGSVSSVEKVDSLTVKFTLNSPWFTFLQAMATAGIGSIYSKKALDDNAQDLRKIAAPGTGPFIFKEYKTGESMSLVRNPNYWNPELPYLDGLTGLNVGPADDRGTAVLTDRGDFAHHTGNTTFKEADNHKDIVTTGVALQWHPGRVVHEHDKEALRRPARPPRGVPGPQCNGHVQPVPQLRAPGVRSLGAVWRHLCDGARRHPEAAWLAVGQDTGYRGREIADI
jgi:ABC-type transport system substrate-binding protein